MPKVTVKKSVINKKGVFALKNFKKGEVVLLWKPKIINLANFKKLTAKNNPYLYRDGDKYLSNAEPGEVCKSFL